MTDINHTEVNRQWSWLQCSACADSGLANVLCSDLVPSAVLHSSPAASKPHFPWVTLANKIDFKLNSVTCTDKSKSMRRQRARLWIHYPGGDCWALVTSSLMSPEQGLHRTGWLLRQAELCAAQDMPATPPQTPSHAQALTRALITLVLVHQCDKVGMCWEVKQDSGFSVQQIEGRTLLSWQDQRIWVPSNWGESQISKERGTESGRAFAHLLPSFRRGKQLPVLAKGCHAQSSLVHSVSLSIPGDFSRRISSPGSKFCKALGKYSSPKCQENLKKDLCHLGASKLGNWLSRIFVILGLGFPS